MVVPSGRGVGVGLVVAVLAAAALLAAGCAGRDGGPASASPRLEPGRPLYEGTPTTRAQIRETLARVPGTSPAERVRLVARVAAHGEAAVPILMEALGDPDAEIRGAAAYGLGLLRDPRSLDRLDAARADPADTVRFEAATAMVRMGDRRGAVTLVDALTHTDPRVRARAIDVLASVTGERFGYAAADAPEERAAAVARWRAWLGPRGAGTDPGGP